MNLMEIPGMIDALKVSADKLLREVSPDYALKSGGALVCKFVLESAKQAGPPPGFAERLQMEPEQAKVLYNAVLEAAIQRK